MTTTHRPATVTITLCGDARGNVSVRTDLAAPVAVGQPISPVQSVALDLINQCGLRGLQIVRGAEHVPSLSLALDLLNPDVLGWQSTPEIAASAKKIVLQSQHAAKPHTPEASL
ncbi:hypothetical protein [Paracidovorax wautersii]|uniref:Uncharacterized protein n=1 Tax=Paracidovorax wautersii TaxID=1177982 RepID=A0A1I2GD74_9BURK|nr:hypothetical protein [Paracidovorax wautersii]SFF15138.1 hypothetical protein SAMN04489711_11491 [Paracidovorax wautersii]